MKTMGWIAAAGFAAAVFALPAAAQMNPPSLSALYAGGEVGQADHRVNCNQFTNIGAALPITCDTKDTAYRLFAGYQFHRAFSVEGGYANLGKPSLKAANGSGDVESTLWDLSVIGALPVGPVSLFGRLGGYAGKAELSGGINKSHDKLGYLAGAGVGFDIGKNIGLRGEWKRYFKTGGGELGQNWDVDVLSIAALWRFR